MVGEVGGEEDGSVHHRLATGWPLACTHNLGGDRVRVRVRVMVAVRVKVRVRVRG